MTVDHLTPLDREIAETGERLRAVQEELRGMPGYRLASQRYLDRCAEKHKLLARLDALRRLASLS